jgi:hypothetical protein
MLMPAVHSETCTVLGFFGGLLFGVVIVVAGKIHWGDQAPLCLVPAEVPFQGNVAGNGITVVGVV